MLYTLTPPVQMLFLIVPRSEGRLDVRLREPIRGREGGSLYGIQVLGNLLTFGGS